MSKILLRKDPKTLSKLIRNHNWCRPVPAIASQIAGFRFSTSNLNPMATAGIQRQFLFLDRPHLGCSENHEYSLNDRQSFEQYALVPSDKQVIPCYTPP